MTERFDTIIIGAGNAGQGAAGVLVERGQRVAVVEDRDVGGTCPNRGCVPKKILVAASETLDLIRRARGHHIEVSEPRLDWAALIERKRGLIGGLPAAMSASLEKRGIELIRGAAQFVDRDAIEVDGQRYGADQFVIATGSTPRPLQMRGASLLSSSAQFLEMEQPPRRAVFVGGGVIAFEFAHVLARVGTHVTILEMAPQPLGRMDVDAVSRLVTFSKDVLGIDIRTGVTVEAIESTDHGLEVRFEDADGTHTILADRAFHGSGRVPNVAQLQLDKAGAPLRDGRLHLDGLRSAQNPALWFAGDVLTTPQLSPVATLEGRTVGRLIAGEDVPMPSYRALPSALYTTPTLASVGLTQAQADREGRTLRITSTDMHQWLGAKSYVEDVAYGKILIDDTTDRIVGAHLLGHGASESIHVLALAMEHGIPASALKSQLYAYPTFTNDLRFLL
ncbi:MAG: NAD(P)/FAD-dependent oxidoreductase [Deltaproteobacteria bacterium]|nr:NAD(P)/FAD-dependent oxidoreductase [Deltaproteobacteria bacterium]